MILDTELNYSKKLDEIEAISDTFKASKIRRWNFTKTDITLGGGIVVYYDNGYYIDIAITPMTYGCQQEMFELAIGTHTNYTNEELTYDTPITDDVIGYVPLEEVTNYCLQVKNLPKKED